MEPTPVQPIPEPPDEPGLSEEDLVEQEIREADDFVELRIVAGKGPTGRFSYVTERILYSKTVGKFVRKVPKFAPKDGTGERGYEHRGDTVTVHNARGNRADQRLLREASHRPHILPKEEW